MTLLIFIVLAPVLTIILLLVNMLLATTRADADKVSTYECGYDTLRGQTRAPFSVSYYLVAVLFLAFDVELLLVYPYTTSSSLVGLYGFWVVSAFFLILTLGFVVEVASGVLNFTDHRSAVRRRTVVSTTSGSSLASLPSHKHA